MLGILLQDQAKGNEIVGHSLHSKTPPAHGGLRELQVVNPEKNSLVRPACLLPQHPSIEHPERCLEDKLQKA